MEANPALQATFKERVSCKTADLERLKQHACQAMEATLAHYHGHNFKAKRRKVFFGSQR